MKNQILAWIIAIFALSVPATTTNAADPESEAWLERPWEIRYVLFAEEAPRMQIGIAHSKKFNAQQAARGKGKIYLSADALLTPTVIFAVPGSRSVGIILLTFDAVGRVTNQKGALSSMSAKRTRLDRLVLIHNDIPDPNPYHFGYWSQGIPGDVTFSPAACSSDDFRRYETGWNIDSYTGNFGCREWTAQLYDRAQPYIDVTSYATHGTFIGSLTGWSRFEDPPKPVIGRHGTTWLCLHECPAGEKPGVIPDIRAWTTKHGFPMPTRPSKQPLYPNADYMDDLNEFWQQ
ncbi:hypothetical protein RCH14_004257 [Massilia sp. MP_M2]|uniref:hypothetical protein n=1 Tax=Massilia sp. MP_M2 TaxID=3071713 RepID=UPI00319EB75D